MSDRVPAVLREQVRSRAQRRCEYCKLHEDDAYFGHQPDHIIASKHRGPTVESNLAWACYTCNLSKGSDIASVDIKTGRVLPLFNPRVDEWDAHFRLDAKSGRIEPLSPTGRVTEFLLQFNRPDAVAERRYRTAVSRNHG